MITCKALWMETGFEAGSAGAGRSDDASRNRQRTARAGYCRHGVTMKPWKPRGWGLLNGRSDCRSRCGVFRQRTSRLLRLAWHVDCWKGRRIGALFTDVDCRHLIDLFGKIDGRYSRSTDIDRWHWRVVWEIYRRYNWGRHGDFWHHLAWLWQWPLAGIWWCWGFGELDYWSVKILTCSW